MDNDEHGVSRADDGDAPDDLPAFDYLIVAGAFVVEPCIGGMLLGELPRYQLREGAKVFEMTQAEFDDLMSEFYEREGYYPDT